MPSEIIIIIIELMFLGVNMFFALLRTHFSLSLSRAKNIFTPANFNSIAILILLAACTRYNHCKNQVYKNLQFNKFNSHEQHEDLQENSLRNSFL